MFLDYLNAKNQETALEGRKVNSARVRYLAENGFADKGSAQTELTGPLNTNLPKQELSRGEVDRGNVLGAATASYVIPDLVRAKILHQGSR